MVFLALIICCWVLALLLSDTDGWVCGVCLHPGRPTPRAQSNEWNIISSITAFVLLSPSCLNSETRIISTEAWGFYLSAVLFFLGGCFFFPMFPLLHGGSCSVLFSSSSVCLFPWLSLGEKKNLKSVLFFTLTVGFKTVRNGKKKRITTKSAFPTAASAVFCHIDTENRLDLFTKLFHSGFTLNPLCAARLMICWQQMHVSVTLKNVSGWN